MASWVSMGDWEPFVFIGAGHLRSWFHFEGNPEWRNASIIVNIESCVDTKLLVSCRDIECLRTLRVVFLGKHSVVDVQTRSKWSRNTQVNEAGFRCLHIWMDTIRVPAQTVTVQTSIITISKNYCSNMQAAHVPRRPTQQATARVAQRSRIFESGQSHVGW